MRVAMSLGHECIVTDFVYALLYQFCAFICSIICRINTCVDSVETIHAYILLIEVVYFAIIIQYSGFKNK